MGMMGLAARKRMAAQRALSNRLPDGQRVADNVALFPAGILTRAAGIVQRYQHLVDPKRHPYDPSWGNPLTGTGTHVGDDPRDTRDIMKGVRAANGQRRK